MSRAAQQQLRTMGRLEQQLREIFGDRMIDQANLDFDRLEAEGYIVQSLFSALKNKDDGHMALADAALSHLYQCILIQLAESRDINLLSF